MWAGMAAPAFNVDMPFGWLFLRGMHVPANRGVVARWIVWVVLRRRFRLVKIAKVRLACGCRLAAMLGK